MSLQVQDSQVLVGAWQPRAVLVNMHLERDQPRTQQYQRGALYQASLCCLKDQCISWLIWVLMVAGKFCCWAASAANFNWNCCVHLINHIYQPGKLRDEENKQCHAMLHWVFPLNTECHQCQPQWIQQRKFGQLQPDWFAPTKSITLDTTRVVYLNSSQLEIDLSFRKQNNHKRVGALLPLYPWWTLTVGCFQALQNNQFLSYGEAWY